MGHHKGLANRYRTYMLNLKESSIDGVTKFWADIFTSIVHHILEFISVYPKNVFYYSRSDLIRMYETIKYADRILTLETMNING